eukprot:m.47479 g.47479  ORF g.47479 m.47479 type:complete len:655 (-) comp10983_c0_seq1:205-2169(-)
MEPPTPATLAEDYYAILNVPRDATQEQIKTAHKQLSKLYHPDKHSTAELKQVALELFPRIQKAYEVLSDAQQRALYDAYGASGLKVGSELAPYYNSIQELRADYELQRRKREQEQELASSVPKGLISVELDARGWFRKPKRPSSSPPLDDTDAAEEGESGGSGSVVAMPALQYDPRMFGLGEMNTGSSDGNDMEDEDEYIVRDDTDEEDWDNGMEDDSDLVMEENEDDELGDMFDDEDEEQEPSLANVIGKLALSSMSIEQSLQAQPTQRDVVAVSGSVTATGQTKASAALGLRWTRAFLNGQSFTVDAAFGFSRSLQLKYQRPLPFQSTGYLKLRVAETPYRGRNLLFGAVSLGLLRRLSTNTVGYLEWQSGIQSSVKATLAYTVQKLRLTGTVEAGQHPHVDLTAAFSLTDSLKLETTGMIGLETFEIGYKVLRQVTENLELGLSLSCGPASGVIVRCEVSKLHQTYAIPLLLSDDMTTAALLYGTAIPILSYVLLGQLVIKPWLQLKEKEKVKERRRKNAALINQRRLEALAAIRLMQETVTRKIAQEEEIHGLVIRQAWYGQLVADASAASDREETCVVDVTIPLQCLVKNSRLELQATSKANMVGFYDPCLDEPKKLRVVYSFRQKLHEVVVDDQAELRIPQRQHLIQS